MSFQTIQNTKKEVYKMGKKIIAVIFGGNSTEYEVSLQSASSVFENINKDKFEIVPIGITRNGDWYHYTGKTERIANNTWIEDSKNLHSVVVSQNRSVKGFLELIADKYHIIHVDLVFPVLHGKNGEDGTLQGLFELSGVPIVDATHSRLHFVWIKIKHINLLALQGFLCLNR